MSTVNEEKKAAHQGTASHKTEPCCHTTFDGKVVSMTGDKLVVANKEGKQCSHTLAKDAKLTRDGTSLQGGGSEGRQQDPRDHEEGRPERGDQHRIARQACRVREMQQLRTPSKQ